MERVYIIKLQEQNCYKNNNKLYFLKS